MGNYRKFNHIEHMFQSYTLVFETSQNLHAFESAIENSICSWLHYVMLS